MSFFKHKSQMVEPEPGLAGPENEMAVPDRHLVLGTPLRPPVSDGLRTRHLRHGLFLGRRAQVLGGRRRLHDGGRLQRRLHAEPDLRGGLLGSHGPRRSGSRRLRPGEDQLREAALDLLGEPRPDPGHAPGQRRRHPVPLRHLHDDTCPAVAAEASRDEYQRSLKAAGYGEITTEIAPPVPSTTRRTITSSISRRNPNGYCGLGGTGVACQVGLTSAGG